MKIVLVSNFFPPARRAGTEQRTLGYALTLQRRGHAVQVVCAGRWGEEERFAYTHVDDVYLGIPVRRVDFNWSLAPDPNTLLYRNPVLEERLSTWLGEWQPGVVHVTSCTTLSASVIAAARARRVPVLLTLTDFWFICPRGTLLRGDGTLCDGQTTDWDCLRCMLSDSGIYRGLRPTMPDAANQAVLTWISRRPSLARLRGFRGKALDIADRRSYLARMLDAADAVTVPSESLREILTAAGVIKPLRVVLSGHDLSWRPANMLPKRSGHVLRVGFLGQFLRVKGLHLLLEAFRRLPRPPRAHLSIHGDLAGADPPYARELRALAAGLDDHVSFPGPFTREHLGRVLSELDVVVVPSLWHENNPRVVQEAFASGTPVIASNVRGIAEFVLPEVNGLLFERNSVEDLANQLTRAIADETLLERLRSGIGPVRTVEDEVTELETIYTRLAGVAAAQSPS